MPQPFRYRIKPGDSWSAIAKMFQTGVSQLLGYNPGVSQLSSGMQIKIPTFNPPTIPPPVTPTIPPPAGTQFGQNSSTQVTPPLVNKSTYFPTAPASYPAAPASSTFAIPREQNVNPYASLYYERDPMTGLVRRDSSGRSLYNYVPVYQNGKQLIGSNGQPVVTARSIYVRDVAAEAANAGVSVSEYTQALHESGYTLFGGMWVYVGNSSADAPQAQGAAPVRAFYRVGAGRDKWVTTEQAQTSAGRRRGSAYQERMEYRNEQERRKKKNNNNDQGATNVNFGVGAG